MVHKNVRKEIVTIDDSDVDDENDRSRDIGRSESSLDFGFGASLPSLSKSRGPVHIQ